MGQNIKIRIGPDGLQLQCRTPMEAAYNMGRMLVLLDWHYKQEILLAATVYAIWHLEFRIESRDWDPAQSGRSGRDRAVDQILLLHTPDQVLNRLKKDRDCIAKRRRVEDVLVTKTYHSLVECVRQGSLDVSAIPAAMAGIWTTATSIPENEFNESVRDTDFGCCVIAKNNQILAHSERLLSADNVRLNFVNEWVTNKVTTPCFKLICKQLVPDEMKAFRLGQAIERLLCREDVYKHLRISPIALRHDSNSPTTDLGESPANPFNLGFRRREIGSLRVDKLDVDTLSQLLAEVIPELEMKERIDVLRSRLCDHPQKATVAKVPPTVSARVNERGTRKRKSPKELLLDIVREVHGEISSRLATEQLLREKGRKVWRDVVFDSRKDLVSRGDKEVKIPGGQVSEIFALLFNAQGDLVPYTCIEGKIADRNSKITRLRNALKPINVLIKSKTGCGYFLQLGPNPAE